MPDGRLYLYGSLDLSGSKDYCSKTLRCFSTDDMIAFRDEGVIFRNDAEASGFPAHPDTTLYAPDAACKNGKYYLFVCCPGGFEGVAMADSPAGPFGDAVPIRGADGSGIDPAVFIDDDGTAYYFWGQFHLKGGVLSEDMTELVPGSVRDNILTEHEHGFHEGASVRKVGGRYYLVYTDISRGRATALGYAVSDSPLGPYAKCGIIIDNTGCDPQTWNDHGSIECLKGQWYVFYHRSSQNGNTCRRVCAEPIFFDERGMIREVPQSVNGPQPPLDARKIIDASAASRLSGGCFVAPDGVKEYVFCQQASSDRKAWAEYRSLDFGGGVSAVAVRVRGRGRLWARCEDRALGSVDFACDDFSTVTLPVARVSGVHAFWLLFEGEGVVLDSFSCA